MQALVSALCARHWVQTLKRAMNKTWELSKAEMDRLAEQGGTCVMMGPGFRCYDSPTHSLGVIQKGLEGVLSQILEDVLEGKVWVALLQPQVSRQFEIYSFSTYK